jgi:cytidine deaminase
MKLTKSLNKPLTLCGACRLAINEFAEEITILDSIQTQNQPFKNLKS